MCFKDRMVCLLCFIFGFPLYGVSYAQISNDTILRQQQEIERQQRDQERKWEDELLRQQKTPNLKKPDSQQPEQKDQNIFSKSDKLKCRQIDHIRLEGLNRISSSFLIRIKKQYEQKCLSLIEIQKLIRDLTNQLVKKGYVTTRIYIPEQDLKDKILRLLILEGKLQELYFKELGKQEKQTLAMSFPIRKGETLNLRKLEQGVDQLNRLQRAYQVKMDIKPGKQKGYSQVFIHNKGSGKRQNFRFGLDNSGSSQTGIIRANLSGNTENLLGFGEFVSVFYSRSLSEDSFNSSINNPKKSENGGLFFSIPYGYWVMIASLNVSRYATELTGKRRNFGISGRNLSFNTSLDRVIYRNDKIKTGLSVNLSINRTKNYIEGIKIGINSPSTTYAGLTLWFQQRVFKGILNTALSYDHGLDILGADHDKNRQYFAPKAQFERYQYIASYIRPFKYKIFPSIWRTQIKGQYSDDNLYGAQRFSIGGISTISGFRNDGLSGNKGYLVQTEIRTEIPNPYFSLSYETGRVFSNHRQGVPGGYLDGIKSGLKLSYKQFDADFILSIPIQSPNFIHKSSSQFYFFLNAGF